MPFNFIVMIISHFFHNNNLNYFIWKCWMTLYVPFVGCSLFQNFFLSKKANAFCFIIFNLNCIRPFIRFVCVFRVLFVRTKMCILFDDDKWKKAALMIMVYIVLVQCTLDTPKRLNHARQLMQSSSLNWTRWNKQEQVDLVNASAMCVFYVFFVAFINFHCTYKYGIPAETATISKRKEKNAHTQ